MRARAAVVAALVVAGGVTSGCQGSASPRPVAEQFLRAVAASDFATAAKVAGVPTTTVRTAYRSFLSAVGAATISFKLSDVQTAKGGDTATATFTASVVPGGYGVFSYPDTLTLHRGKGDWHVTWAPTVVHPELRQGRRIVLTRQFGPRAAILDGAGRVLVHNAPVVTVGVEPQRLHDRGAELATLAGIVGVDVAGLRQSVAAAAPTAFVPVITLRRSAFEPLRPRLDRLAGVPYRAGTAPLAPTPTFARALLGRVGEVTADELKRLGPPYRAGDTVGLYGIQAAFERRLAGTPTARIVVEDRTGHELETLASFQGTAGQPVQLTIDRSVQAAAERALGNPDRADGPHVSLVAVRASTGQLLAVANRPGQSSYDAALVGRYPPGSTFKVVTTTALLSGGLHVSDPVPCPPSVTVQGKQFSNFQGESTAGNVPFRTDFAMSCNTAFVGLAQRLGAGELTTAAKAYGLGGSWELPLPVFTGSVPPAADAVERAADAIGQGKVLVSPLDMALVAAGVDAGTWNPPSLVVSPAPAARPSPRDLPPDVAASLRGLMRSVVTSGTARQAFAHLPGPPVFGKTGTAEFGGGNPPQTHAWFIGFRGDVAFAVIVEGGGVGGVVAAPIAASFLRALPP